MNHFSSTVSTIVRQKRRSEGYLLVLLVHGFLVLRESRRSLSVEPVQVVTLCAKVTCTGINGVEIMTRVPRRHGDRHGESKDTSTKAYVGLNPGLKRTNQTVLLWMRKADRRRQSGRERLKRTKLRAASEKWIRTKARLTKKGLKRKTQRRAKAKRRRCEKSRSTKM